MFIGVFGVLTVVALLFVIIGIFIDDSILFNVSMTFFVVGYLLILGFLVYDSNIKKESYNKWVMKEAYPSCLSAYRNTLKLKGK